MHKNITNIFIGQHSIHTTAIQTEDIIIAGNLLNLYNIFEFVIINLIGKAR